MSMLSAEVAEWSATPKPMRILPPPAPIHEEEVEIRVLATGLHQLVRTRAAGKHYTSTSLPHVPGVDGVGVNVSTGKKSYFTTLTTGEGTFAEIINVPVEDVTELPGGVDPVVAAALMNPVMSSWMGLKKRVDFLKDRKGKEGKPWKVLIMGATSASGKIAIKVARTLGATQVVGAARNKDALAALPLDSTIILQDPPTSTDFSAAADADVVLDYLYGPWPAAYLTSATTATAKNALTWVGIGAMAGDGAEIPAAGLRRRDVSVRGAGPGAWKLEEYAAEVPGMLNVLVGEGDEGIRKVKMEDVEEGWMSREKGRVVFVFGDEGV
ncbi:hypothetical protein CEP51_002494 [Fusarium floridanum]|uniref:Enoyl reductase (ER) domain-containing protein n=1 Tax=Fusarium floridanum TaxID=1325733 RepID=A0A428SB75_9HYPO|nr:hypothetical protein CEP51_002494 [Fusarium floridanum]